MLEEYYNNPTSKKTVKFDLLVQGYRNELKSIWNEYTKKETQLQAFKDSKEYDKRIAKLVKERDKRIADAKEAYNKEFNKIIIEMENVLSRRKMVAPPQDELAIITALKNLEKVSRDEIIEASHTISNPTCLKALEEIAKKHNIIGVDIRRDMTTSEAYEVIESLKESKKRLMSMDRTGIRSYVGDFTKSEEERKKALYTFRIDTDTSNYINTMNLYGGVSPEQLIQFENLTD